MGLEDEELQPIGMYERTGGQNLNLKEKHFGKEEEKYVSIWCLKMPSVNKKENSC
jgi:hypothetical protein